MRGNNTSLMTSRYTLFNNSSSLSFHENYFFKVAFYSKLKYVYILPGPPAPPGAPPAPPRPAPPPNPPPPPNKNIHTYLKMKGNKLRYY